MREIFGEYYALDDSAVEECVLNGTIVLDTNVLLGLYRFSKEERETLFALLESARDRLWIPYQVALEYQRNRLTVAAEQAGFYDSLVKLVQARTSGDLKKALGALTIPDEVRSAAEDLVDRASKAAAEAMVPFVQEAQDLRAQHVVSRREAMTDDPVRNRIDELLDQRIGAQPDASTRAERIAESKRRYQSEIPPGYKDAGEKGSDELEAGDYLLWAEILEFADHLKSADSLLFVTQDTKADWFDRSGAPLPALRREFAEVSAAVYHQVTLKDFLTLANKYLGASVDNLTIDRAGTENAPRSPGRTSFDGRVDWAMPSLAKTDRERFLALLEARAQDAPNLFPLEDRRLPPHVPLEVWLKHLLSRQRASDLPASVEALDSLMWRELNDALPPSRDASDGWNVFDEYGASDPSDPHGRDTASDNDNE